MLLYIRPISSICTEDIVRTASAGDCRAVVGRRRDPASARVAVPVSSYPAPAPATPACPQTGGSLSAFFGGVFGGGGSHSKDDDAVAAALGPACPAAPAAADGTVVGEGLAARTVGKLEAAAARTLDGPVLLTPSALHTSTSRERLKRTKLGISRASEVEIT